MDLLQNPFYILNATTRDNKQRIMELAEEHSLFQDAGTCTEARSILTHPRERISAEVAWMPGIDPQRVDELLKLLESSTWHLLNITGLMPLAQANLIASGLSRLSNPSRSNIVEWILKIARVFEYINPEDVHTILNNERRNAGFPEISNLSTIEEEIQNRRQYYRQATKSAIEKLSAEERAEALTVTIESASDNNENLLPVLIEDLVASYEVGIQSFLEKEQRIIEALDEKIRVVADIEDSEIILTSTVNQLIEAVKKWDILAQPIQISKKKRGEYHNPSFDVAWRVRNLAIHLCNEYDKPDVALQLTIMLQEVFAEVPQIAEHLDNDRGALEERARAKTERKRFENEEKDIKVLVERLREAVDVQNSDTTLAPIVNRLIQAIKSWAAVAQLTQFDPSSQRLSNESIYLVAVPLRELTLHLWNEHGKLDFAIQLTNVLLEVFKGVPEIAENLREDSRSLNKIAHERAIIEKFEDIKAQVEELQAAVDAKTSDYTLSPMVTQLTYAIKKWNASVAPSEANHGVMSLVCRLYLYLWNEHYKLDFAIQLTNVLLEVFRDSSEIARRVADDKNTLDRIAAERARTINKVPPTRGCSETISEAKGWGCLIFIIIAILGALFENC